MSGDTDNAPKRRLSISVPRIPWLEGTPENLLVMQEKPDPDWYERPNRMRDDLPDNDD